jgi:hypothetical protein
LSFEEESVIERSFMKALKRFHIFFLQMVSGVVVRVMLIAPFFKVFLTYLSVFCVDSGVDLTVYDDTRVV